MADEPLTPNELDIAQLAGSVKTGDAYLLDLAELADSEITTSVALVVSGMFVFGILTSGKAIADEADIARSWIASRMRKSDPPVGLTPEEWQEQLDKFSTAASTAFADHREWRDRVDEESSEHYGADGFAFDSAPASVSRRFIQAQNRAFLTLRDAQIAAPGQVGVAKVPTMRVAIAHVAAWWIVQLDEDGRASFPLFSVDQA